MKISFDSNMDNKRIINRIKIVMIAGIAVLLCLIQVMMMVGDNGFEKYILTEEVIVKHNGKKIFEGNIDDYKVKNIKSEDNLTMEMSIPSVKIKNPTIIYDNINTSVKLYVNEKEIYSIGEKTKSGGIVCHAYNKAPLEGIKGNEKLTMDIRVMNGATLTRLPRIKMMDASDIDKEYIYTMLIYIVMGIYLFVIGIVGILIISYVRNKNKITIKLLVMSILSIVTCMYIISTFQVIPLFSDNLVMDAYCEYICRFLLLITMNIYMCIEVDKEKGKNIYIFTIFTIIYSILAITLQALGILYVNDTMAVYLLSGLITGVNVLIYYMKNMKSDVIKKYFMVIGSVLFVLVALYSVILLFFGNVSDYFLVMVPIILLTALTTIFIDFLNGITQNMISGAEKKALSELAYIDILTGLYNRRALEKFEEKVAKEQDKNIVYNVYSFDLNDLKKINDTYGHAKGDSLIKDFAKHIENVFKNDFCIRMGGDEFVVIEKKRGSNLIEQLYENIKQENMEKKNVYDISYSYGCATFNKIDGVSIHQVIDEADKNMYDMKMEMKNA